MFHINTDEAAPVDVRVLIIKITVTLVKIVTNE